MEFRLETSPVGLSKCKSILVLLCVCLLVACTSGEGPDDKIVLKVAHNGNEQHPFHEGYENFARELSEQTGGRVVVEIFPNSQLGSEEEAIEMVKLGVIGSTASAAASLGPFVPEIDVLNFPFIFTDLNHFYRVLDGPVGQRIGDNIENDLDMIVLGWWFSGVRNVWNEERPINVPSDLEGLKIRVIGSAIVLDAFNTLGAQATTMSFGELYSAVQQGVLDGGESDHTDLLVEKFYEVTKYVSLTKHLYLAAPLTFSRKKFDKLPVDIQTAILEAGRASVEAQRRAMENNNEESLLALVEIGLEFNEVNGEEFRKKIADGLVYERNAERVGGQAMIDELINQ
ncbi:MAG: TRAP transporter substrate-binding protein [Woeseia sp.]|jgi:TRAP-type transport system periplasmic protein|nr:TRAP transporter substrate-binding protein [Woeseia sp.]